MHKNKTSLPLRKTLKLSTGNYREPGLYFLTSCFYENVALFGTIQEGKLTLNSVGKMIGIWWEKLPGKYSRIELRDFIVMPNHFHGIIMIKREEPWLDFKREEPWLLPYGPPFGEVKGVDPRVDPSIPRIMQWFKTMSTNEFLRHQKQSHESDIPRLWQRSYYDHIIHNDADYNRISEYIRNNPGKWIYDRFHP